MNRQDSYPQAPMSRVPTHTQPATATPVRQENTSEWHTGTSLDVSLEGGHSMLSSTFPANITRKEHVINNLEAEISWRGESSNLVN